MSVGTWCGCDCQHWCQFFGGLGGGGGGGKHSSASIWACGVLSMHTFRGVWGHAPPEKFECSERPLRLFSHDKLRPLDHQVSLAN